ncbi:putative protein kinase RLK-Pelle-RLCK-IXb family [Helianthus annuus]|nr:putative protein kinase RLK-Pelle-RLCK-IXb family [Helianthus annuus]KAJ0909664.1 putative protein kinase RLK-Pelle-RLCK-IXb family [Helianthus annuus]
MENGSSDKRLFRKNDIPLILWFNRFRITWKVVSALNFLLYTKPRSIVHHRDQKPANILLDKNLVSKIGDVGLSTMHHLHRHESSEYQPTGLVSPKS